jgi:outer membrane protein assembly factor BamD
MKKIAVLVLITLFAAGCAKTKTPQIAADIATSDEALFREGEKYVKKDREKARLYFRQVIDSFPKSFYAQRAKLAIADSYYDEGDEGNMLLAASEYREFVSLYPASPSAPYAQYRIAMTFYQKAAKPGREQTKTVQAIAEFKKVLALFPLSEEAKQARDKITECEDRYAEHLFLIAEFYFKTEAYVATVTRLNEILTNYPLYSGLDRVFYYLGATLDKSGVYDKAVPYYTKVVTDYPKSKLAAKAQERLKFIKSLPPPAEKK